MNSNSVGAASRLAEATIPQTQERDVARGFRAFLHIPEGLVGILLALFTVGIIGVGPFFAPYSPSEVGVGFSGEGPSGAHLLGTDALGRDVLSRLLTGGASGIVIPLIAVMITFVTGGVLGMTSGFLGGWFDAVLTRIADGLLSLPHLMLVLVIMAGFGTGYDVVGVAIVVVYSPMVFRVLRGATQAIRPREYVLAARARGDTTAWIVRREIMPNLAPTLLVEFALRTTWAIILFATLSFLGLGAQPPSSNWGIMVAENRSLLFTTPVACLAPTAAIAVLALSINLIADALTQYFTDGAARAARL